jgi:hypothetical protein
MDMRRHFNAPLGSKAVPGPEELKQQMECKYLS